MLGLTDVIASFLFVPVTLFIIIPLVMLCGWLLFKLMSPLTVKKEDEKKTERIGEVISLTEMN